MSKRSTDIATAIVDVARRMGYDVVQTEAVSEFRDVFVALQYLSCLAIDNRYSIIYGLASYCLNRNALL